MLSYQHAYHAGNFADVLKHIVLIQVIDYIKQKDKPFCYIDTHAGQGDYRLDSFESQKNKEFESGIEACWNSLASPPSAAKYLTFVKDYNKHSEKIVHYPGSPMIANRLLRNNDRLFYYELHPKEIQSLRQIFKADKRCKVFHADGLNDSLGLLPPHEHRGLILIDPSYELKTDYQEVVSALTRMYKRFSNGCYLLWYPVVARKYNQKLERELIRSGIRNIHLFELCIRPDSEEFGMTGCGMIAINPPWTLRAEMQELLPRLSKTFESDQKGASFRVEELISQ